MNVSRNRKKQINPVHFSSLVRWFVISLMVGAGGLFFVYIKNQQFALGDQIRIVERKIRDVRAENEVLLARITELSSRRMLQQRIAEGFIKMQPIQDNVIARLTLPTSASDDGVLRTAFNERTRQ